MITLWIFTTYLQARGLASVKELLATLHILTGILEVKHVMAFNVFFLVFKKSIVIHILFPERMAIEF